MPLPLVVDTDTASDDAVALILATVSGLADVRAVTVVAGNVPLPQCARNALSTLELVGAHDVPVHLGCDRPLVREASTARHVHGADGMGEVGLSPPVREPDAEHAVDALLRLAAATPGELTLVTLGPLTNLAAALVRDRGLLGRFRHVYCMAGAPDAIGNISPTAEYNVWADPEAAAIVLAESTVDRVTWIGWDVSRRDAVLGPDDQDRLRALGTPFALFADGVNRIVGQWAAQVTGLVGYDLPDPIAMAVALDPTLATRTEVARVRVALGDEARGQLLVDHRRTAGPPNVTLVRRADGARFRDLLFAVCARQPDPLS